MQVLIYLLRWEAGHRTALWSGSKRDAAGGRPECATCLPLQRERGQLVPARAAPGPQVLIASQNCSSAHIYYALHKVGACVYRLHVTCRKGQAISTHTQHNQH